MTIRGSSFRLEIEASRHQHYPKGKYGPASEIIVRFLYFIPPAHIKYRLLLNDHVSALGYSTRMTCVRVDLWYSIRHAIPA